MIRIEEDYLRIIRFIRFSIHYNCKQSDPETIESIKHAKAAKAFQRKNFK